jgi:hypothetical protein
VNNYTFWVSLKSAETSSSITKAPASPPDHSRSWNHLAALSLTALDAGKAEVNHAMIARSGLLTIAVTPDKVGIVAPFSLRTSWYRPSRG